ncbi:ABC transporter substrate-binding protein [Actinomyces viscosus]|uniref:Osmoprotectant-binding protein n=1 Tax=Actinomyces viscosus TaxID=1656 RepID=A0A3S4V8K0_ACTVI|nr:ABC transporter substrate-binding protein [Actinomyces viscosus]TFH53595.1 ABC transporter substrate-binding protein [Actinomyces viscosus]VEI14369.1 Osmoprotectant-binding protein [Actinomyces viscosus]
MTAHPSPRSARPLTRRGLLAGVGALGGLAALSACSNTDPFAIDRTGAGYTGGPIIIGSQQYYSNEIIAELYAQMLEKADLTVTREYQIGQREVYLPELESGRIHVIPEYGGNLLEYYSKTSGTAGPTSASSSSGSASPSRSASDTASIQNTLLTTLPRSLTVLTPAEATDQDSLTVTRATAQAHSLTSIADLTSLGRPVTIAANSEFTTRPYGPEGLNSVYGVEASVTPVEDSGGPLTVKALTDGTVDVADIYSSDPAIQTQDLVILSDPRMLILPQNVTPLVSATLPAIAVTAINRVSALLTPDELRALNQRSTGEGLSSKAIATDWLTAKKLL